MLFDNEAMTQRQFHTNLTIQKVQNNWKRYFSLDYAIVLYFILKK